MDYLGDQTHSAILENNGFQSRNGTFEISISSPQNENIINFIAFKSMPASNSNQTRPQKFENFLKIICISLINLAIFIPNIFIAVLALGEGMYREAWR